MKFDKIFLLLSLGISALVGYGFYWLSGGEQWRILISIVTGVLLFTTLTGLLAIKGNSNGSVVNIKIISGIFLVIAIIINVVFTLINFMNPAAYIIVNGVFFLLYILVTYSIKKALE